MRPLILLWAGVAGLVVACVLLVWAACRAASIADEHAARIVALPPRRARRQHHHIRLVHTGDGDR